MLKFFETKRFRLSSSSFYLNRVQHTSQRHMYAMDCPASENAIYKIIVSIACCYSNIEFENSILTDYGNARTAVDAQREIIMPYQS